MHEVHVQAEDVDGRKGEDRTCHDHAAAGPDALDYDVLPEGILALESSGDAYGEDGDGDGRLEHLAHLEAEVCGCGRKQYCHDKTECDGIWRHLR